MTHKWRKRFKDEGDAGLKPVERTPGRHPETTQDSDVKRIKSLILKYPDAGAEFIAKKLAEDGIEISAVTVRSWRRKLGLADTSKRAASLQRLFKNKKTLSRRQVKFVNKFNSRFGECEKLGKNAGEVLFAATISLGTDKDMETCSHMLS